MKKIIFILIVVFANTCLLAQTTSGVWDSNTATYTNVTHQIKWHLIDGLMWVPRPIISTIGDILFKMRNDDTKILVKLSALKTRDKEADMWNENAIKLLQKTKAESSSKMAEMHEMQYIGTDVIKDVFCEMHALWIKSSMKKYYPEYNQTTYSIDTSYVFFKNGYVYTVGIVAITVLEEDIEIFENIASILYSGFSIK